MKSVKEELKEFSLQIKEKQERNVIRNPASVGKHLKGLKLDLDQENGVLFCLDTSHKVIKTEALFKGGVAACVIDPKVIFRHALKHKATAIIFAHNHPSSNLEPSTEDIMISERLKEGAELLAIDFLDSIIFNHEYYYSMKESSTMKR
jgi:DNA repair protein RadC